MRNLVIIVTLFLLRSLTLFAGGGNETSGARATGVGGVGIVFSDGWAATNNPAGLASLENGFVGTAFESRFFLPEAGLKSFAAAVPIRSTSFGLAGHSFGYAGYSENRLGFASAKQLSEIISLGVQVNVMHIRIGDIYGNKTLVSGTVGLMLHPNDRFLLAAVLENPSRPRITRSPDERIPTKLCIGTSYIFSDKVRWVAQFEKDLVLPPTARMGIEYEPSRDVFLRVGYTSLHRAFSVGLGYRWNNVVIDLSQQWNQRVGFSATASLGYNFTTRKKRE